MLCHRYAKEENKVQGQPLHPIILAHPHGKWRLVQLGGSSPLSEHIIQKHKCSIIPRASEQNSHVRGRHWPFLSFLTDSLGTRVVSHSSTRAPWKAVWQLLHLPASVSPSKCLPLCIGNSQSKQHPLPQPGGICPGAFAAPKRQALPGIYHPRDLWSQRAEVTLSRGPWVSRAWLW